MNYQGKPLAEYSLDQLMAIDQSFCDALVKRDKARSHPRFDKQSFPEPNPAFTELHNAIKQEILKRENTNA